MICARCQHFRRKAKLPEDSGTCGVFLMTIDDVVRWDDRCRLYRPAREMRPREDFIKAMENDHVRNKNAVDPAP